MKTIFTSLLILMLAVSSLAQKSTSTNTKNSISLNELIPDNQTFSVTKLYPNPVKDIVTVEVQSELPASFQVSLINILGTEVKKWDSFAVQPGEKQFKLDLSFLKTGVYFLKINVSGHICTQVLKKN